MTDFYLAVAWFVLGTLTTATIIYVAYRYSDFQNDLFQTFVAFVMGTLAGPFTIGAAIVLGARLLGLRGWRREKDRIKQQEADLKEAQRLLRGAGIDF